jgi:hypothetical protein
MTVKLLLNGLPVRVAFDGPLTPLTQRQLDFTAWLLLKMIECSVGHELSAATEGDATLTPANIGELSRAKRGPARGETIPLA